MAQEKINPAPQRSAKWDNVKALMIIFVVLGHFMFYIQEDTAMMTRIYIFIHLFHMPVFVFISGLFARKTVTTGHRLKEKVLGFVVLAYLLKFTNAAIKLIYGTYDGLELFRENSLAWYLFAMAMWLVLTYLLRGFDKRALLVISVLLAVFAGYDKTIGGDFSLSRVICFYPFFLLGLACDRRKLEETMEGRQAILPKILAALVIMLSALLTYVYIDKLYLFFDILKGWRNYNFLDKSLHPMFGPLYRLIWYAGASLLGGSIILLTPARRCFLSAVGARTLQIYLFHRPILYLLRYNGWFEFLQRLWPAHWHLLYLLSAVVLALILALPVFEIPIKAFWKALKCSE